MKKLTLVVAFAALSALQVSPLYAGEKLGKVFIKASSSIVDGQQFADQDKEDSVKDMKERAGKFVVVDSEKEADYLVIVVERNRRDSVKVELVATISFKQNGQWKPGTRLIASSNGAGMAARRMMGQVNDWVEARGK